MVIFFASLNGLVLLGKSSSETIDFPMDFPMDYGALSRARPA